jgi:DNA-directed RNA polymerase specialized sigma24 family protein
LNLIFVKLDSYLVPEDLLLQRLANRDEQAFEWLYDQYAHVLYGVVLTSLGQPAVAQQVVEEVFVNAWHDLDQFNPKKTHLLSWLLTRARQEALRVMPQSRPADLHVNKAGEVDNLISPEHRTLLDAVYFRGQGLNTPQPIEPTLRRQLRLILQELKLVFSQ